YHPSSRHLIDASFFASRDNMAVSDLMGLYWGNVGASLVWQARAADKLMFNTTASLTHFDPKMTMDIMNMDQRMLTYIRNYSLNERVRWNITDHHGLELGYRSELLRVKSAEWVINNSREREIRSLWENALWIEYAGNFNERVEISAGVRAEFSSVLSGAAFHDFLYSGQDPRKCDGKTYVDIMPRLSIKYQINQLHNIKLGVGSATQNLHAIRSSATSFPFDRYALTSSDVKPERALQYGVGYSGMNESGRYDWSAECYYRSLDNVYDYKDGRSSFSDIALENIILGGKGRSYGLELMFRKNVGRLTGWIAYTLSRTETKIPGINDGKWYNASNDCRHDLSISGIYKFSNKWSLSASWVYMSGKPLTAPDVKYEIAGETCYYYSRRNAYKTPSTHRLDISAKYTHAGKRFTYEWAFGVYNTYCRYNPYIVYFEDDPSKPSGTRAVLRAMYGLVPSVSYTLKF
ncbi:MAG: outer membrane beta-barrel protein, partial [Duncaniella sp.]|nr:outer membrane beta-barrel protein [Duncaniella sp.]